MVPSTIFFLANANLVLKRCEYPMVNLSPPRRASAISSSASHSCMAIGFSKSTCLPALRQSRAIGKWVGSGVVQI